MKPEQEISNDIIISYSSTQLQTWKNEAKATVKMWVQQYSPEKLKFTLEEHKQKKNTLEKSSALVYEDIVKESLLIDYLNLYLANPNTNQILLKNYHAKLRFNPEIIEIVEKLKKVYPLESLQTLRNKIRKEVLATIESATEKPNKVREHMKKALLSDQLTSTILENENKTKLQQALPPSSGNLENNIFASETRIEEVRDLLRAEILILDNNDLIEKKFNKKKAQLKYLKSYLQSELEKSVTPAQTLAKQLNRYLSIKFQIDVLRQLLFKNILAISEQEKIRFKIFSKENIKPNENNANDNNNDNDVTEYRTYLQYKYTIERGEKLLLKNLTLYFHEQRYLIELAQKLTKTELFFKIERLKRIIDGEMSRPGIENSYLPYPELYRFLPAQYPEILKIYQFVYYKKLHRVKNQFQFFNCGQMPLQRSQNVSNLKSYGSSATNPHRSLHHSERELKAQKLFEEGFALCQKLLNIDKKNETTQKIFEEAQNKLQQAIELGSIAAKNYLQNELFQIENKFGYSK